MVGEGWKSGVGESGEVTLWPETANATYAEFAVRTQRDKLCGDAAYIAYSAFAVGWNREWMEVISYENLEE